MANNPPSSNSSSTRVPPKDALNQQVYLLRNNMMGPAANYIMVITTIGRKSGQPHTIPIAYIRDGDTIVSLNNGGVSNWYKNVLVNPRVVLEVKGQAVEAQAEPITDPAEIERLFEIYKRDSTANFERLFGVPLDSPQDALLKGRDAQKYVRFRAVRGQFGE